MATPLPLEGDGFIENLFYFLWCKDDFGAGPRIFIPHTVLYKFSQPSAWYFTSLRSGKIKKKAKVNLTNLQIEHEFTKKRSASDIVAYYIYFSGNSTTTTTSTSNDDGQASATTIEYFDTEALRDFLYKRDKTQNGMLQKFVLPKSMSNATIRAIWSPKICLLERRVNLKNVYDKRFSIYDRGVTFDGADMHSRPEPVRGAMLPGEVQILCEQIVDHVTQVSYHKYRISRMVLHLKSDADDKLWLLWCSSLRLLNVNAGETSGAAIRPLDIVNDAQVPEFVQFRQNHAGLNLSSSSSSSSLGSHSTTRDEKRLGFARCMSCGLQIEQKNLLATTYKAILDHFQRFMRFLRLQVNESEHAAIEWPPDERLVQAAGGVGFGILHCFEKGSIVKKPNRVPGGGDTTMLSSSPSGSLTRKELVIPPVIQYLHPNFSIEDFERHRQDPIFLHKPVAVCESCCLVYSDYTTTSLEVNSIRQSAPAILRPHCELSDAKKRLDPLNPLAVALSGAGTGNGKLSSSSPPTSLKKGSRMDTKKPPASAWKPISASDKAQKTKSYGNNNNFIGSEASKAPTRSTMSSWPSAPQLPQRIDSFEEIHAANFSDLEPGSLGSSQSASVLQKREETFFRELHQQKDLERGHPLHHMLESATRLEANKKKIKQQQRKFNEQQLAALRLSSSGNEFGKSRSMGALPELFDQQQMANKKSSKSPYSIVLRLREADENGEEDADRVAGGVHGSTVLGGSYQVDQSLNNASPQKKKRMKKVKKLKRGKANGSDGDVLSESKAKAATRFVSSCEKKASEEHQNYLFAALSQAQTQVRPSFCSGANLVMFLSEFSNSVMTVYPSWSTWSRSGRSCLPRS